MDKIQETIELLMTVEDTVEDVERMYNNKGWKAATKRLFPGSFTLNFDNLSNEEKKEINAELCTLIQSGDTRAEKALIYFNMPMLFHLVWEKCFEYGLNETDYEDVLLDCATLLVKLAQNFDPDKASFFTYAYGSIEKKTHTFCMNLKTDTVSLDESCKDEEGNKVTRMDVTPDERTSTEIDHFCMEHSIREEVKNLPDKMERKVISLFLGLDGNEGLPIPRIARQLGLSNKKTYTYYKRALDTLCERLDLKPAA